MLEILAEKLYQDAVNLSKEIHDFEIKLIQTQSDYQAMDEVSKDFDEGKIDLTTYKERLKFLNELLHRRWLI